MRSTAAPLPVLRPGGRAVRVGLPAASTGSCSSITSSTSPR